jgi:hypothetical protein
MTDMVNVDGQLSVSEGFLVNKRSDYQIDETYWGYIVRGAERAGLSVYFAQAISMVLGAASLTAAAALWLLPTMTVGADETAMRVGVSVLFTGVAALFLWYASRGTETELQIDTTLGEIREVVRNRAGKTTLLGRYGFDSIGGVCLDRNNGTIEPSLLMRYRNTAQTLLIAQGSEESLIPLRDRLGRDMIIAEGR